MNPAAAGLIAEAFSMKREIRLFFAVIVATALIPMIAVLVLTQAGIDIVSGALASQDAQSVQVDIRDPATGQIVDHVATSAVWPVSGPVSLEFGQSDLPYQPMHTGIDIATTNHLVGDPVAAFMDGTVANADSLSWGFGTHVIIDHGHHVTSTYGHLDTLAVKKGDKVVAGTVIGTRGTTGWSTGPHLHFQINVFGIPVNPRTFLTGNP